MLKITVLTLLVVSCSCQDVIEFGSNKLGPKSLPLKAVSGVSTSSVSQAVPVVSGGSSYGSSYGVSGGYGSGYGSDGFQSVNNNLAYLKELRNRVLGSPSFYGSAYGGLGGSYGSGSSYGISSLPAQSYGSYGVNIAPSVFSSIPFQQSQSYLAIRQPQAAFAVAQPALAIAQQPAIAQLSVAQPALAVHRGVAVAQPAISYQNQYLAAGQVNAQAQIRPVNAAITQVARTVEYRPVPYSDQPIQAQDVIVEPSDQPINIHFRSRSSTVRLSQEHIPGEVGEVQQTQSQDEASRVQHEVIKPVVQEIKEIIQPYRQVTQEINPVVENVNTVVQYGEGQRAQYVAEPIVKQNLVSVQPAVQQLAVQQVPAVQQYAVQQPALQVAIARPALSVQQVQPLSIAAVQPVQAIRVAVPRVEGAQLNLAQPVGYGLSYGAQPAFGSFGIQSYGVAQPVVGGFQSYGVSQPAVGSYQSYGVSQPAVGSFQSYGVSQPVVGVNRFRSEVREFQPGQSVGARRDSYYRYSSSTSNESD